MKSKIFHLQSSIFQGPCPMQSLAHWLPSLEQNMRIFMRPLDHSIRPWAPFLPFCLPGPLFWSWSLHYSGWYPWALLCTPLSLSLSVDPLMYLSKSSPSCVFVSESFTLGTVYHREKLKFKMYRFPTGQIIFDTIIFSHLFQCLYQLSIATVWSWQQRYRISSQQQNWSLLLL